MQSAKILDVAALVEFEATECRKEECFFFLRRTSVFLNKFPVFFMLTMNGLNVGKSQFSLLLQTWRSFIECHFKAEIKCLVTKDTFIALNNGITKQYITFFAD